MLDDPDFDEVAHEKLLRSITGKSVKSAIRRSVEKISAEDLLASIKNVKQSTSIAKNAVASSKGHSKHNKTIATPIHRQERERIQGAVGYIQLKKDLAVWNDVIETNRLADQLKFPLNEEKLLVPDTAAEKTVTFKAKTDLEKEMAEVLKSSKHNLTNETVYTEAEMEILKAMNVKEAKSKLEAMQKMRALISYREAKYHYAAKIKSKGYHRILKRQKRKQLIKEFDDLLVRDPQAAKEKLAEIENQRIIERASLKHRARNKFQQEIAKHAGHDPNAKKLMEEHMRLGRELKSKVALESDSDDNEEGETEKEMSVAEMIKSAAVTAAAEHSSENNRLDDSMSTTDARIYLYQMRAKKRNEMVKARVKMGDMKEGIATKDFEEDSNWTPPVINGEDKISDKPLTDNKSDLKRNKKTKGKTKGEKMKPKNAVMNEVKQKATVTGIDELFDEAEDALVAEIKTVAAEIRSTEVSSSDSKLIEKKKKVIREEESKRQNTEIDISLDPSHFLQVDTENLSKVSGELADKMDEFDEDQVHVVAEAFKDDDVIGDFAAEKEMVEEGERHKDVDLTLQGWGCWVGPGMTDRKRRKQFIVKAKEKKRKDIGKAGVIIKELQNKIIEKLQPNSLPFPYTRVEDFQTMVSQPVGIEWNPVSVTRDLCKPAVVTMGGRSIRPIDKSESIKQKIYDTDSDDN